MYRLIDCKEIYENISLDQTQSGAEVRETLLGMDRAEIYRHSMPKHWEGDNPGKCPLCNEVLDPRYQYQHVYDCLTKQAEVHAAMEWQRVIANLPSGPCPLVPKRNKVCGKVFPTLEQMQSHLYNHFKNPMAAKAWRCKWVGCKSVFESKEALIDHFVAAH